MGELSGAHRLLGRADGGELILLVGPEYGRMQQSAAEAGIEAREANRVQDVQTLKAGLIISGRSLALIASAPEVEGPLDRSAFGANLTNLAYDADRVVYFGSGGSVVVHPMDKGTRKEIRNGRLCVRQALDTVGPGETVIGIQADRIG